MLRRTMVTNSQIMHVRNGFISQASSQANELSVSKDVFHILYHLSLNFREIHNFLE